MSVEGIEYVRAFYAGIMQVHPNSVLRYEVLRDFPCCGESAALIIEPNDQGRRKKTQLLTLFSPFTLQADQVTETAGEICTQKIVRRETTIEGAKEPKVEMVPTAVPREREPLDGARVDRLARIITDNWRMRCRLGLQFDLDVAALVLQRFGKPIPEERPVVRVDETGEARKSGKGAGDELVKPVNPESKPGQVLQFFMEQRRSLTEAMAQFGSTRSSLQSSLHHAWKAHGVGYSIQSDIVTVLLPSGCEDPFKTPAKTKGKTAMTTETSDAPAEKKVRGKPMKDEMLITPLPEKGKRREVALATYKGWAEIKDVAEALECSEGSVRSHLNDLHIKHGYGFEIDGAKARLLVPKGFKP